MARRVRFAACFPVVGIILTAACGGGPKSATSASRTDSAGVEIVTNPPGQVPAWQLARTPSLDVGSVSGDTAAEFVHLVGAITNAQGEVIVADAGLGVLRSFNRMGQFVRQAGGKGKGPGEFTALDGIWRYRGDSVIAWDRRAWRATVFDSALRVGRVMDFHLADGAPHFMGAYDDGALLIGSELGRYRDTGHGVPVPQHRTLIRYAASGASVDSLGTFHTYTGIFYVDGDFAVIASPIFDARTLFAVSHANTFVALGARAEFRVLGADGATARLIRWDAGDRHVTSSMVNAYRAWDRRLSKGSPQAAAWRRMDAKLPVASQLPALDSLAVGAAGVIWVERFSVPPDTGPRRWDVFDSTGVRIAAVHTPRAFHPTEIHSSAVLGVWLDPATGIAHVRRYAIVR